MSYNLLKDSGVVGLTPRKGYEKFSMVGMYYYLPALTCGRFNGFAIVETNNPFDSSAVAIYEESGQQIGHISKAESKRLHKYITKEGGKVHAYGYVQIDYDGYFCGEVCVEVDKNKVTKRNAPYKIQNQEDILRF